MNNKFIWWQIPIFPLLVLFLTVDGFAKTAEELYREGVELSLDGAHKSAVEAFQQAISLKPQWAEAHHALGVQYFKIDSGYLGVTHLRKAARYYRKREDPQARKNLAIVEKNLKKAYKKLDVSLEDFDVIELDPGYRDEKLWQTVGVGFLVGGQGFLMTPYHNLENAQNIRVRFADGKQSSAKLVKSAFVYDVAILRLDDPKEVPQAPLSFGEAHHLREGDPVFLIDLEKQGAGMVQGPILAINALEDNTKFFHVGLPLQPDHSGSPLLNALGEVVGMAFSQKDIETNFAQLIDVSEETSFALKSSYLKTITSKIFMSERIGHTPEEASHSGNTEPQAPKFQLNAVAGNVVSIEISRTP